MFSGLESLRRLRLYDNHLTLLSPGSFQELTSLQHLNLSENGIFPKWGRKFIEFSDFSEFRESDKSLKYVWGSI